MRSQLPGALQKQCPHPKWSWAKAITPSKSLNGPWLVMGWHKATLSHKLHLLLELLYQQQIEVPPGKMAFPEACYDKAKKSSQQTDGAHRNGSYMETTKGITATTNTLLSALSKMSHTSLVGGKDRPKFRCLLSQEKKNLVFQVHCSSNCMKKIRITKTHWTVSVPQHKDRKK